MKKKIESSGPQVRRPVDPAYIGLPKKVTELISKESDRGVILVLAAYLEEILGFIIRAACVSDKTADDILAIRKPAGDFDSRVLISHAFGLIHSDEVRALRLIQKIRNRAAHFDRSGRGFDVLFDSASTADQVNALVDAMRLKLKSQEPRAIREGFIIAARAVATRLLIRFATTNSTTAPLSIAEHAALVRESLAGTPLGERMQHAEESARAGDLQPLKELIDTQLSLTREPQANPAKE